MGKINDHWDYLNLGHFKSDYEVYILYVLYTQHNQTWNKARNSPDHMIFPIF